MSRAKDGGAGETAGGEGFLDRWSRLKTAPPAREEGPEAAPTDADASPEASRFEERSDEDILAELGLPDPSKLQPGDDVKGFMQDAVPDRIRRLALRQLWRSNPVLANLDELVDYGEDYTDAATVIENLQTAYKVGEGMVRRLTEDEEDETPPDDEAEGARGAEAAGQAPGDGPKPVDGPDEPIAAATDAPDPEDARRALAEDDPAEADRVEAPPLRRMAFTFDD